MRAVVWWKWILGAVVGIMVIGALAADEGAGPPARAASSAGAPTAQAPATPTETVSLRVGRLSTVHTDSVMVKGKVTDGAIVYVNDEMAEVSGRKWWVRVDLDEGENDLEIEAEKPGLRSNSAVETVTFRERTARATTSPGSSDQRTAAPTPTVEDPSSGGGAGSPGQRNALDSAKSYLELTAFSETGLVEQLESEGFSNADARWAVANVTVDWNAQAVASAKSYLDLTSFSRSGLIEQLESEGFTSAQASYGVSVAYR